MLWPDEMLCWPGKVSGCNRTESRCARKYRAIVDAGLVPSSKTRGAAHLIRLTQELFEPRDYPGIEPEKVRNELGDFLTLDGVNVEISLGSLG